MSARITLQSGLRRIILGSCKPARSYILPIIKKTWNLVKDSKLSKYLYDISMVLIAFGIEKQGGLPNEGVEESLRSDKDIKLGSIYPMQGNLFEYDRDYTLDIGNERIIIDYFRSNKETEIIKLTENNKGEE
ncbi:MAG: hypothetical protein K9L56_14480 [Clostridiales bacterium]|nr:hypothetical protein [Clostridiales bacterium]